MAERTQVLPLLLVVALSSITIKSSHALFFSKPCEDLKSGGTQFSASSEVFVRLMRFSAAAYEVDQHWTCDICKQLGKFELRQVSAHEQLETLVYTGYDPVLNGILVVFRGTHTIKNWLHNLRFAKTDADIFPKRAGRAHRGFLDMYKSVRKAVFDSVDTLTKQHPDADIYVTGHSLGGALAVLGALDIKVKHPSISLVMINFGAPRVGNKCFSNFFGNRVVRSLRVVNRKDTATMLPPSWLGYKHVPGQLVVEPDTNYSKHSRYLGVSTPERRGWHGDN